MCKQLRIWLFVLLGTLLATSSLLAEGVITMTTTKVVGEMIALGFKAKGDVTIEGAQKTNTIINGIRGYTIESQTVTIKGDVTTLNFPDNQLTNLNISGCTALTELNCSRNQLTSLDVSGCTALTTLYCRGNQLTSLDVSKNTALTKLNCWDNQLTSLNVSGCTALTELWCYENQLTSLDVSGCSALKTLHCYKNQLTSLDVSGCTALKTLHCYKNQLTSLNVSGCTALTELWCYENQLTSLNVSDCTALTELWCYENQLTSLDVLQNTSLTELYCGGNQLTSLDVSSCTALKTLTCNSNKLTSLNLSGCTSLTKLDCTFNQLTSLDVSCCTALTTLDCTFNQLTSLDVSGCTVLTTLYCSDNLLRQLNVTGCSSLTKLDCSNNQIKGAEMVSLVNSLPDRQGKEEGIFYVFKEKTYYNDAEDGNVCLAAHVASAKAKNWRAQFYRKDKWRNYAGLDKPTFVVTYSSSRGGSIIITGVDDLQNVPYDTELTVVTNVADGYKLTTLTANGQDIIQTKHFKVTANTEVKAIFADNTGVETAVTQQMKLYPNPATDYVIVEGVAPASEVTLHSMTGERLYAGRADDRGTLQIDLTPYADGVYLICVAGETYRVVVRH